MSVLSTEGLSIGHGTTVIASGIDLTLAKGSVMCLLGPNGAGKTTLFRTLLGLLPQLSGTVTVAGTALSALSRADIARRIAYVPQNVPTDFAYTVLDLVVMGRTAHLGAFATPGRADRDIALRALDGLGITALAQREVGRISGGQRQLALIARALAQQADLIVMDEPTASLDLGNRLRVLDRVTALAAEGHAVLLSTHEPEQAFAVADRVAILGPDRHFRCGPPAEILTDAAISALYGAVLQVETTTSGRRVVGPRPDALDEGVV